MTTDAYMPVPEPPRAIDRSRLLLVAAVAATGVVFGAFAVVASLSSSRGFEWKTFLPMLGLAVGFAAGAALNWLDSGRLVPATLLTGALGSLAIVTVGIVVVSSWDGDGWVYVSGLFMLGGGAAAYALLRQSLLTVAAVVGAVVFIAQAFSDSVGDDADSGTGTILGFGIVLVILGVAIAAAGWRFECRHLTGALGSIVAVGAMVLVLVLIGVTTALTRAFSVPRGQDPAFAHSDRDLWIALFIGLAVSLAVAGLGAISGLDRYLVIAFIGALLCTLIGIVAATREHPLRAAAAFAFVAGLVVAAAVLSDRFLPPPSTTAQPVDGPPVFAPPTPAASTLPPPMPAPGSVPPPPPPPAAMTDTTVLPPVDPPKPPDSVSIP